MVTHRLWIAVVCSLWATGSYADLLPADDVELSSSVAQQGVALDIEYAINADSNGVPLSAAPYNNCSGLGNGCRIAFKANNRNSFGGEWLVFKDAYASMRMNNLYLDAATTPATSSIYANPNVFKNTAGVCIVAGCTPNGLPALQLSFPGSATVFEEDISLFLNIGRIAIEHGAEGYNYDKNGSFAGIKVSDSQQTHARIDIDGKMMIYGF